MGPWTYFAPIWIGTLVNTFIYVNTYQHLPAMPVWAQVLIGIVACPLVALLYQAGLMGFQGISAQVLPVPAGRSIRGRGAATTGVFIVLWLAGMIVAGLLWSEHLRFAAYSFAGVSVISLAGALISYVWNASTAVRDFDVRS